VWAPAKGRSGGGLVIADAGDGWEDPELQRFGVRWSGDELVVEKEGDGPERAVEYAVRVRGV
ncbi:hypothetical protein, partial [Streptomyces lasiicapitis]